MYRAPYLELTLAIWSPFLFSTFLLLGPIDTFLLRCQDANFHGLPYLKSVEYLVRSIINQNWADSCMLTRPRAPLENCPRIIEKHSIINWYVQVSWVVAFPHWFKRQRHLLDPNWIFLHKYYGFTLKALITVQHLFNAPITCQEG